MPYEMSIETSEGVSERPGFHLGTIERVARDEIEARWRGRINWNMPTVTIALIGPDGRIADVYDGEWKSVVDEKIMSEEIV